MSRLADAGLLPVQVADGLAFWPFTEVALVMEEFEGRLAVLHRDGTLAHRPGPADVPTLVPLGDGVFANPRLARRKGAELHLPGGWRFPRGGDLAVPEPPPPVACPISIGEREVDLRDMRGLTTDEARYRVTLADRSSFTIAYKTATRFVEGVGLAAITHLEPLSDKHAAMYRMGLRDFPYVLLEAPAEELRRVFGDDNRSCVANLLWEAARHRWRGQPLDYGTEHRGFYYRPVLPVLNRLGARDTLAVVEHLVAGLDVHLLAERLDPLYRLYADVLADLVGEARLLTLRDLGFAPTRPELRALGTAHPDVLLVVEKASLEADARRLAAEFGVSLVIVGGMARWEAAEPLADLLRPSLAGRRVRIVAYGDYDPEGWEIPDVLVRMLARYDVGADVVGRLVLPRRFTPREIELLAEPIPAGGTNGKRADAWMARTDGIGHRRLGLHADHLRPYTRVRQAFLEEVRLA